MVRGSFDGEELDAVAPSSTRRWILAAALVALLVVGLAGWGLTNEGFSAFPKRACKGVGIAGPIVDAGLSSGAQPVGHPTPEDAIAAFAPTAMSLNGRPVPADGWEEYRGRWVRDLHDGSYLELGVHEGAGGWQVGGDYMVCGR
jgi:hypothetical protein